MGNRGMTLIGLVTVMAIIGILLAAFGFSYQDWMAKYSVESATKELHVDLMKARTRAIGKNREHYVVFMGSAYSIIEDSNDNGAKDSGDAVLPGFPRPVELPLIWNGNGNKVIFEKDGLMSNLRTIVVRSTVGPDYDCVKVSTTRIIMGQYNGDQDEAIDGDECEPK